MAGVDLTRAERADLLALLRELDDADWASPTPCPGWDVADVVAHLLAWEGMVAGGSITERWRGTLRLAVAVVRARFRTDRLNERLLSGADRRPASLLAAFDRPDADRLRWRFDRVTPGAQLAEYVIHHRDIRTAVGRPKPIPPDRLAVALGAVHHLPGLRKVVHPTALDGEALLLHLAGRGSA